LCDRVEGPHQQKHLNEDPSNKDSGYRIVSDGAPSDEGQEGTEQDVLGNGLHDPAGPHQVVEAGAEGCQLKLRTSTVNKKLAP
jgi:hypothetical protein